MKLVNSKLEFKALRTVCGKNGTVGGRLLALLKTSHFQDETAITKDGNIPSWEQLELSTKLPDNIKREIKAYKKIKPIFKLRNMTSLFNNLEDLRKGRVLFKTAESILNQLDSEDVDIEALYNKVSIDLNKKQRSKLAEQDIVVLGDKKSSKKLIDYLINDEKKSSMIPTGFSTFDAENGGLAESGLTTIASTSGGGKSVMLTQMSLNMADRGYKCAVVPLEMTSKEMGARYMSNISGIDVRKFTGAQQLTQGEKKLAKKTYTTWEKNLQKSGGHIRMFVPEEDMSIEQLLAFLLPYDPNVVFIDYIGLLGGIDGDDQWQKLGQVARYAKRWATFHNKRVVLFAQLSEEGQIRYSKAIKDHSDSMWSWVFTEQNREMNEIYIIQQKARNQRMFDFSLGIDFSTMRMFDLNEIQYTKKKIDKIEKFKKKVRKLDRESKKLDKKKKRKLREI